MGVYTTYLGTYKVYMPITFIMIREYKVNMGVYKVFIIYVLRNTHQKAMS